MSRNADQGPEAVCLHHLFQQTCRDHPDRIAITSQRGDATYRELDRRSSELARRLRSMGVTRNTLVGLCTDRSVEMIVGMLAILKAGGGYLPIDPAYPERRIRFLLTDSGVSVVVTVADVADRLTDAAVTPVLVGRSEPGSSEPDADPVPAAASGHDLAYVIYTSGSTGTPKGVMVEHGSVVRLFSELQPWFGFSGDETWTMFHSASFDFSVWEIWGALLYGGRLVIVPSDVSRSPERFHAMVRKEGVSVLNLTPSAFRQLVAIDRRHEPLSVRQVILGGEALDVSMLGPWFERYGDEQTTVVNMYGITETTVHATYRRVRRSDLARPAVSPIGVPIPDLRIHLLDEARQPVLDGVIGEMYIEGPGVARGYLGRDELTRERFIDGPNGTRLYRSGDLARSAGGELQYVGRSDDQLKLRGFRVEPREIEACLGAHADVADVVVVAEALGEGDQRLKAYVLPDGRVSVMPTRVEVLRAELAQRATAELPMHMRPSSYVIVRNIPLTAHGKVDRQALARLDSASSITGIGPVALPPVERRIALIWEDVLQIAGFGLDDDCFDLGATSLGLARMIARINDEFCVSLNGSELDDAPTVAAFAKCVREQLAAQGQGEGESHNAIG